MPGTRIRFFSRVGWGALVASLGLVFGMPSDLSADDAISIDRDAFLKAIAEVETGGNPRAVGRLGERGLYQFRKETWRQHTRRSFFEAHNPNVSYQVASQHFDWLYDGLVRNGVRPTNYLLAAAWNAGLSRALSGNASKSTRNYARRVANIAANLTPRSTEPAFAASRFFIATGE